jgi:hypothetical protein
MESTSDPEYEEISFQLSGIPKQGANIVLNLDPEFFCNCRSNPKQLRPCTKCEELKTILGDKAQTIIKETSEFLNQLRRTEEKLREAEAVASKFLQAHNINDFTFISRSVSTPSFNNPPETPDSAFHESSSIFGSTAGSLYSRSDSTNHQRFDLDNFTKTVRDISDENFDLCDELSSTESKVKDLRRISALLNKSLNGNLDQVDSLDIKPSESDPRFTCPEHRNCIPRANHDRQMRIVLNNFEKTIQEMLATNEHLFENIKVQYIGEVEKNPQIASKTALHVWGRFSSKKPNQ